MYKYENLKEEIFTEDGQEKFLKVRDEANRLLEISGSFTMGKILNFILGDTWEAMACVDRLVELGEIKEVTNESDVMAQNRVFVKSK